MLPFLAMKPRIMCDMGQVLNHAGPQLPLLQNGWNEALLPCVGGWEDSEGARQRGIPSYMLDITSVIDNDIMKITSLSIPKGSYHETWHEAYDWTKEENFSNIP